MLDLAEKVIFIIKFIFNLWCGLVLWHINHCWSFNAKSCFYIGIKYMICKHILLIRTVKWSNSSFSNNSIQHKLIKFNSSKYCYVSLTIQSFIYTQLNDQTLLFQTIQISTSHMFALSINVRRFYLTHI